MQPVHTDVVGAGPGCGRSCVLAGVRMRRCAWAIAAAIAVIAGSATATLAADKPAGAGQKISAISATESKALGLPTRSKPVVKAEERENSSAQGKDGVGTARTIAALGAVVVLIVGLGYGTRWGARWFASRQGGLSIALGAGGRAPSGILHVLGRYPISRGLTLVLLKVDRRVLLVSQSGGRRTGVAMTTLCEITDPEEVASIVSKSSEVLGEAMSAKFNAFLSRSAGEMDEAMKGGPVGVGGPGGPGGAIGSNVESRAAAAAAPMAMAASVARSGGGAGVAKVIGAKPASRAAKSGVGMMQNTVRGSGPGLTAAETLRDRLAAMQPTGVQSRGEARVGTRVQSAPQAGPQAVGRGVGRGGRSAA